MRFAAWVMLFFLTASASAQSLRPGWGSIPYADASGTGVTFRTWAPNASTVAVAGVFNGWSTSSTPLLHEGGGVWSRDVTAARPGDHYKYVINGALWRRDPYSRLMNATDTRNSIVYDREAFAWTADPLPIPPPNELVIYELHVGTFFAPDAGSGTLGGFADVEAKLDHLADLGVNALELMPVSDFATTTSWGYNPSYPFAVSASYGSPDDLKRLVQACHERGLSVIMDVVHNHYGDDNRDWSLWAYDGWVGSNGGGIYFSQDPVACCSPWGPRPDYTRPEVRSFITDNFLMWADEYRITGFRWDAPKYILYADGSVAQPVPDGTTVVHQVMQTMNAAYPDAYHIAEDVADLDGFDGHWDFNFHGVLQGFVTEPSDTLRNMSALADIINRDPKRVIYSESHDTTGDLNNGRRLPNRIDSADADSYWAQKRSSLAAAITLTAPGTPMIWQGQEFYETNTFSSSRPLDWSRTNTHHHITRLYRDLIRLRRNLDGVSAGLQGDAFEMRVVDADRKVMVYRRYATGRPDDDVIVVLNASNTPRDAYSVPFPSAGFWFVNMNTDSTVYGEDYGDRGPFLVEAVGDPATAAIDLGRYTLLILSRRPHPDLETDTDGDGLPDWWETHYFGGPTQAVATADSDGDFMTNAQEYRAGTDPLDHDSALRVAIEQSTDTPGTVVVRWSSVADRIYRVLRTDGPGPYAFEPLVVNVAGVPPLNTYTDTTFSSSGEARFYRIQIE